MAVPKDAPFKIGDAVAYHRGDSVQRGIILAHGRDGCRVLDAASGRLFTVVYDGLYRHLTVPGTALRPAVVALAAMGLRVHLTDAQRATLEKS
jgi:hypothetical protein